MAKQSGFECDVFVSYEPSDEDWVRKNVQRWLEAVGLVVLVEYRDFWPGMSRLENIERAVAKSRYTVAVLTSNAFQSPWTTFQMLLAVTQNVSGRDYTLIPLITELCNLPLWINYLVPIDFTDRSAWGEQKQRLFRAVSADSTRVDEQNRRWAVLGLGILRKWMSFPEVSQVVNRFKASLEHSSDQITKLRDFKAVHQKLHEIQLLCHHRLIPEGKLFPDNEQSLGNLQDHERTLGEAIDQLRVLTSRPAFRGMDTSWLERLGRVKANLHATLEPKIEEQHRLATYHRLDTTWTFPAGTRERIRGMLSDVASELDSVIGVRLAEADTYLNQAMHDLVLSDLVETLRFVHNGLTSLSLVVAQLEQLNDSIDALDGLDQRLKYLVRKQDSWQEIDLKLRMWRRRFEFMSMEDIEWDWTEVREKVELLCGDDIEGGLDRLKECIADLDTALKEKDRKKAKGHFDTFFLQISGCFYRVDEDLNGLCRCLVEIAEPLDAII